MTNYIAPGYMTELSAVNYVLRAIGEAPITDIGSATQADVQMILGHFNDVASEVCALDGYKWNSEIGYTIQPTGQILYNNTVTGDTETLNVFPVPPTLASYRINPNYAQSGINYVDLGFRQATTFNVLGVYPVVFYDRDKNREGFNAAAYPTLQFDVRWFVPFVNMPYAVQMYITARTARRAVEQNVNSSEIAQFIKTDEAWAYRNMHRQFGLDDNYNDLRTVNAYRAYGNRPATNVGFIDQRGLAPSMTSSVVAGTNCTVSNGSVTELHGQPYSFTFTITNPNTIAVSVTLQAQPTGSVVGATTPYLTVEIPAGAAYQALVNYVVGGSTGSGSVLLSVGTSNPAGTVTYGTLQVGTLSVTAT